MKMKTIATIIVLSLLTFAAYSQEKDTYGDAMKKQIALSDKAETAEDFQACYNAFERISNANEGEWLPLYYMAYCYINLAFVMGDIEKTDAFLDKAQTFLDRALELSPKNHELYVLQGFLYQGRIQADPMGRGMQYSMKSNEAFGMAQSIQPDNPRIYFLQAMNLLYTPEAFGGGANAACPLFSKAREKYATFVPDDELSPDWGKESCENMLGSNCEK